MLEAIDPAGVAVFVAAIGVVVALTSSGATQWGARRLAFGIAVCAAAIAAVLLTGSTFLYVALFFGGYQIYIGWGFISRRRSVGQERRQYVTATAKVLSYVALADGMISPKKSEIIRDTYLGAGFSKDEIAEAEMTIKDCAQAFVRSGSNPATLFDPLKEACEQVAQHSDNQTRFIFLRTALRVAASDGFVSLAEEKVLRAATVCLGLQASDIDAAWSEMFGKTAG